MKLFYEGRWQDGTGSITVKNSYDGAAAGQIAVTDAAGVTRAIDHLAKNRVELSAYERSQVLFKAAKLVEERKEELAQGITAEASIPIKGSRHEISRSMQAIQYAAEEAKRICGETIPGDVIEGVREKHAFCIYQPAGVIAAITPFNHPLNQVVHKIAPAIAAGNAFILKPSEKTPLTAARFIQILLDAGFPPQNMAMVLGDASAIGKPLVSHAGVDMVSFTGSTGVGEWIMANAGVKKICLELGGNEVLIVDEAADLEKAADTAIPGAFGNNGQRCTSIKRLLLHNRVAAAFLEKFVARTKKLVYGDPKDPKTDIGSLIDKSAADRVEFVIRDAVSHGAEKVHGDARVGNVIPPTILDHIRPEHEIVAKETFGPTAPILRFDTMADAIRIANDTPYGLQAGVFTNDLSRAFDAARKLRTGAVMINEGPGFRIESLPFGGVKKSGIGREGIKYAVREMSQLKTIVI